MKKLGALIPLFLAASTSFAAVQQVNFTLSDGSGNNATGFITYDDTVVATGQAISGGGLCSGPDNSINYTINISGGTLGTVAFDKSTCSSPPAFCNVPDFQLDVNFFACNAGGVTGNGISPNTFRVTNGGASADLVFQSISAPVPASVPSVPTLSTWAMLLMASGVAAFAIKKMRRQ